MLKFNIRYLILTLLFFLTEVLIALFVSDNFIRPYFGDVLVVILMYCFVRSFMDVPVLETVIAVLLFAFLIEFFQYLNMVEILGWQKSRLAKTVLGHSFSWADVVAYITGAVAILVVEKVHVDVDK